MNISILKGKTLTEIKVSEDKNELIFLTSEGKRYMMLHYQDCCESVYLEDICGDLDDLINSPIIQAEENSSNDKFEGKPEYSESFTWTFYRLATQKGQVVLRWYGESNGYYSESVDFEQISAQQTNAE